MCSLRCENRLSGEGKTYSITCDGGKWIDEEKIPSCDGNFTDFKLKHKFKIFSAVII